MNKEDNVTLKDILVDCLDLGINSEFTMSKGIYYENTDKTGRIGYYENRDKAVLTINSIEAIDKDGNKSKYDVTHGKTISEIKEENLDCKYFYHVVTKLGQEYGWNESTENDIETQMIKGSLSKLKEYLPIETIEFLCETDLLSTVDRNEYSKHFEAIEKAMLEYRKNLKRKEADWEL